MQLGYGRATSSCLASKGWSMATEGQEQKRGRDQAVGGPAFTRRGLTAAVAAAVPVLLLRPQEAAADILDLVTGNQKSTDFLARLKVGKVYVPVLDCNSTMACWDDTDDSWYDFPREVEGYTKTPTGVQLKDLAPRADVLSIVANAPLPDPELGTNTIEIFSAGYIIDGAQTEALEKYYSPTSKKSKYYDIQNKDPRMFQMQSIVLSIGKSKLIPGFQEGVSTMRVGMRRSFIVPAALAYGETGTPKQGQFLQGVPPNSTLLFNVEVVKVIRGG
mmetsp:Transcript_11075/g.25642  ORF Transcript_11075/g.25642 Transcript_11075/m.25642 type:complete len:274 (-) Transcript_11075:43-864(-)